MSKAARIPAVAMITGASAGIGRATARLLARRGYALGLLARGRARLEDTRREVEALGGKGMVLTADVAEHAELESAAEVLERHYGPIGVWINNAAVTVFSPARDLEAEEVRRVTEVSYLGYVNGTLIALKRMLPRDTGVIIQVGSALTGDGLPLQAAFCGARLAVEGFTQALRTELLHDRSSVKVSLVRLPSVNTPRYTWARSHLDQRPEPPGPLIQTEVAARAVAYAVDHPGRRTVDAAWPHFRREDAYATERGRLRIQNAGNLWNPALDAAGAHGVFDDAAKGTSSFLWLNMHRGAAAALGLCLAGFAVKTLGERASL